MKKFALTTLAVMAAVGVLAVQPADAKKVQQCACQPNIECHADGNRHAERGNGGCTADGEQGKGRF